MTHVLRDILKDVIGEQEILALNKCHIFTGEVSIVSYKAILTISLLFDVQYRISLQALH